MPMSMWHQLLGASRNYKPRAQRGFALPETLIASVIAAGVIIAAAQTLGMSARSSRAISELETAARDAQTIIARMDAGMDQNDALRDFDGWQIDSTQFNPQPSNASEDGEQLQVWTLRRSTNSPFELNFVRYESQ